jgi:hypothetical protein
MKAHTGRLAEHSSVMLIFCSSPHSACSESVGCVATVGLMAVTGDVSGWCKMKQSWIFGENLDLCFSFLDPHLGSGLYPSPLCVMLLVWGVP